MQRGDFASLMWHYMRGGEEMRYENPRYEYLYIYLYVYVCHSLSLVIPDMYEPRVLHRAISRLPSSHYLPLPLPPDPSYPLPTISSRSAQAAAHPPPRTLPRRVPHRRRPRACAPIRGDGPSHLQQVSPRGCRSRSRCRSRSQGVDHGVSVTGCRSGCRSG